MLGRFNCSDLFASVSGRHELLRGGNPFGVAVSGGAESNTDSGVIDFGLLQSRHMSALAIAPPGYYEEAAGDSSDWVIERDIIVSMDIGQGYERVILTEVQFLPNLKSSGPVYTLLSADGRSPEGDSVLAGSSMQLNLRISVENEQFTGYLGKWMILCFHGEEPRVNRTVLRTVNFIMAVKLTGRVGSSTGESSGGHLNVDSRPFIPKSVTNYFDKKVPLFLLPVNPLLPESFKRAENMGNICMPVPEGLSGSYRVAVENRKLPAFIDAYEALRPSSILPTSSNEAAKHLSKLSLLAGLEESHMNISIKSYDIPYTNVSFRFHDMSDSMGGVVSSTSATCVIKVKGSQENRPSILIGATIRIRSIEALDMDRNGYESSIIELQGIVRSYKLATEQVFCEFPLISQNFSHHAHVVETMNSLHYQVRFTFDRCGLGFIQESIQSLHNNSPLLRMIFPGEEATPELPGSSLPYHSGSVISSNELLNDQQMSAVHYLATEAGKMRDQSMQARFTSIPIFPYVIFGPPGTGKTVTVVESIRQIMNTFDGVRILACAPSDAAADVLCQRISAFVSPKSLFRLNWWQRIPESVPIYISPHSLMNTEGGFELPDISSLCNFTVIVSTCGSAGALRHASNNSSEKISFDFIFIDEACQALEAEALVPISYCRPTGCIVLAGDQYQLGPQPRSPVFSLTNNLQSLQERILRYPRYSFLLPKQNQSFQILPTWELTLAGRGAFLRNNYRSHSDILEVSSKMFYGGALVECANPDNTNALLNLKDKYAKTLGPLAGVNQCDSSSSVIFIGCNGTQRHELDSPSYYNSEEIESVVNICQYLTEGVDAVALIRDIGVIAAYRSQVLKLRQALRAKAMGGVNVGSVEDFQGRETRIVIISTVISDQKYLMHEPGMLGLLGDPKRFNVAVTRGIASTILVGHPSVLRADIAFRQFLDYCKLKSSCIGDMWPDEDDNNLEDGNRDQAEADHLLHIAAETALGYGRGAGSFLGKTDPLEAYYRDDIEWRSLL